MLPFALSLFTLSLALVNLCSGQGNNCPDSSPSAGPCSDQAPCQKDHQCVNGFCCPSCKKKAQDANALPPLLKAFIPQCDPSGNYSAEQCQESTNFCWCVTELGQEIPRTRIQPGGVRSQSCLTERQQFSWQCPAPVGFGTCDNKCTSDADCAYERKKCCSNGCGRQCMSPITTTAPGPDEKSGICPAILPNSVADWEAGDKCLIDAQCSGIQKCCSTPLGKKCLNPENTATNEDPKPGVCPPVPSAGFLPSQPRVNRCTKDSDCINWLKCCDTTSGKTCVLIGSPPAPVKPQPGTEVLCSGLNEEFLNCGDPCPKHCDNFHLPPPAGCANGGCSQGCFCKPGFVRQNSRDPRAPCVLSSHCAITSGQGDKFGKNSSCPVDQLQTLVAQAVSNGQAQGCNYDKECPGEQKCCKVPAPFAFLSSPRCLCPDSNAIWKECGSACPDSCQSVNQGCASIQCISGCFCVEGYVRQSNNSNAPCVPRNQCPAAAVAAPNVTPIGPFTKAIVKLSGNNSVEGIISFEQTAGGVHLTGSIQGLRAGLHGFHVHALGDISNGCVSTGPHFDPEHQDHGGPQDLQRHVGDLGNIASDRSGVAIINLTDPKISLNGASSIIGRSLVVHDNPDDLGRGSDFESKKTGNTGPAIACGIIGIVQ